MIYFPPAVPCCRCGKACVFVHSQNRYGFCWGEARPNIAFSPGEWSIYHECFPEHTCSGHAEVNRWVGPPVPVRDLMW